ncbi:glutamate--tRNA ligase [Candidatus Uhrbacteria bacterium]|nr:glutamate--tRNA ligase [Candidatus Uhrbacteria bacterium]
MVRVRMAPSPTGPFHIGTARTALFNWLFARHHGGKFIVRIEDTDVQRSKPEFEQDILEGLRWLGLDWDEGPGKEGESGAPHQRDRIPLYSKALQTLLENGSAYHCFCTNEELEADKAAAEAAHLPYRYTGRCRTAPPSGRDRSVIRFRIPEGDPKIGWDDLIRGTVEFDRKELDDVIISKSLGEPLYNFAVVVDDAAMNISHVIRGEDHISNTPKQILIAQALGVALPQFAHIPLILNADRTKMSKRKNQVMVSDYRHQGYLPEALVNFLALLGWNPGTAQELFSLEELGKAFDLNRVQKSGAIFSDQKLQWFNQQYLNQKNAEQFMAVVQPYLPTVLPSVDLKTAVEILRPRVQILSQMTDAMSQLFGIEHVTYPDKLLIWPKLANAVPDGVAQTQRTITALQDIKELLTRLPVEWSSGALEAAIKEWIAKESRSAGEMLWPLRVALSGAQHSPTPFELLAACGKELSLKRIEYALQTLQ